jgi:uncharacterized protein (DUF885 family)
VAFALVLAIGAFAGRATETRAATRAGTMAPAAARTPFTRPGTGDAAFTKLGDAFLDHMLRTRPQLATRLGVHTWDHLLIPVTQGTLADERAWFHAFRDRLDAVPRTSLAFGHALERDLLVARVDRELLDLEVIRPWETNPNSYLDPVASGIQSLLQRDFASPCRRIVAVTGRLRQVPEVLRAARINLRNPPHLATEVAIAQFAGVLHLYREQIAEVATHCKEPRLLADLSEADTLAVRAIDEFIVYLRDDLLARSNGAYALGPETYQRKLRDDEMETTPVDTLLAEGWRALDSTRARMEQVAERIAPGHGVPAAIESLEVEHPDARELVPFISAGLDSIRAFLRRRNLLTLPAHENLHVRETPVFRRSLSFASMESPGVWERRATEAYFNVTPAEPSWSAKEQRDHLAFFNRWAAPIVSIHEALPGHYYQFLALARVPSRLRQFLGSGTNTEGWAHYCEQMAIEEGFGGGDPRFEFAQLDLALQRLGRFVVGISLHTQGMSYDEAVKVFEDRCWMSPVNAAREARRGILDPTYLVYTLGKWRILELREELRNRLGDRFRLKDFHDAFLRQGNSALPVVRAAMLHDLDAASIR